MRRIGSLLLAVALVAVAVAAAPAAQASFPGDAGRIVFVDEGIDDAPVIASMNADGSGFVALTSSVESPYGDVDPTWSPGGAYILFTRLDAIGRGNIWRMNADGTGQKRITAFAADDGFPGWSPDGARIVFASRFNGFSSPPADWEIYSVNFLGGDLRKLTDNSAADVDPAWSPDRTRIIFSSDARGPFELYSIDANGGGRVRETDAVSAAADDGAPDWDPTTGNVTFTRIDATGDADVMLLNPSSGLVTPLVADPDYDAWSAYSPAQGFIVGSVVFQTDTFGDDDIAIIDKSGGPVEVITAEGHQTQPDWQPLPPFPLVDAAFSTFEDDIVWLFDAGITVGCSPERYCPDASVTRAEMATFLSRALGLPATATDYFTDDENSIHEGNINRLRGAGITFGCGPGIFCPLATLTRAEMASFLARAFALPVSTTDHFSDDDGTTHEQNINRIADAGITTGCAADLYCPFESVTRGQMAAFLHRAVGE